MVVVGNLVRQVDQLRLERRLSLRLVLGELGRRVDVDRPAVFGDALAGFPGEVQAGKSRIAVFEMLDDAQRLAIVVETTVFDQQFGPLKEMLNQNRAWP